MTNASLKIAFHMMGDGGWTVGPVYLRNIFHALRKTHEASVSLKLLTPAGAGNLNGYAKLIDSDNLISYPVLRRWSPDWVLNGAIKRITSYDRVMQGFLRKHGIGVVFGFTITHKYSRIATLSWFPDFQHIHLPEMFSEQDCHSRDRSFRRSAKISTRIILMSESVREDFESFAPEYSHKIRVLNPISYITESVYENDLGSVLDLYNLPEKFVYMPNQFWKHKNHELVFRAVKVLKDRGVIVTLVCTGNPGDCRHSTYFADLFYKLSKWDVRDQVVYLGLIPHEHVLVLMRQSICVLNPSLFEGWGYTVDEARSVGKRVLLSDIPTHREQDPPASTFFNSRDVNDLAEKLGEIWLSEEPGPDTELELKARRELPDRLQAYGEDFFSVAKEAFEEVNS